MDINNQTIPQQKPKRPFDLLSYIVVMIITGILVGGVVGSVYGTQIKDMEERSEQYEAIINSALGAQEEYQKTHKELEQLRLQCGQPSSTTDSALTE